MTGGRNGYGAKLANIFSSEFTVETADSSVGKRYTQRFRANMTAREDPLIVPHSGPDFTCITFKPELARFGMEHLDEDIVALLSKRVYDMAGVLGRGVAVFLNGKRIPVSGFQQYAAMFVPAEQPMIWERPHERWEVGITMSDSGFQQVSYVNAIATSKGASPLAGGRSGLSCRNAPSVDDLWQVASTSTFLPIRLLRRSQSRLTRRTRRAKRAGRVDA